MIKKLTTETKVGFFVALAIVLLVYATLRVGQFRIGREEGYQIYAKFKTAVGVDKKTSVKIAGVEVGKVEDIYLEEGKAKVRMRIYPNVKIPKDSQIVIRSTGLLGDRYVEIVQGTPESPPLKPGEQISEAVSQVDIDQLIAQASSIATDIKKVTESLSSVLGGTEGEASVREIVKNIREISTNFNAMITKNDEKISRTISNFELFARDMSSISSSNKELIGETIKNLQNFSKALKEQSPDIIDNLKSASESISVVLKENRPNIREGLSNFKTATEDLKNILQENKSSFSQTVENLKVASSKLDKALESITSVAQKIDKGEGAIGKLVSDKETAEKLEDTLTGLNKLMTDQERFKLFIDYKGEYLFDEKIAKNYLSLIIKPREDKYYSLGGVAITSREKGKKSDVKFNLQLAKRFYDVTFRAGMLETTMGGGIDYSFLGDKIKASLEAFDFDRDGDRTHLKASASWEFYKHLFLLGGFDDFISRKKRQAFFLGIGINFSDDDLKSLISRIPIPTK